MEASAAFPIVSSMSATLNRYSRELLIYCTMNSDGQMFMSPGQHQASCGIICWRPCRSVRNRSPPGVTFATLGCKTLSTTGIFICGPGSTTRNWDAESFDDALFIRSHNKRTLPDEEHAEGDCKGAESAGGGADCGWPWACLKAWSNRRPLQKGLWGPRPSCGSVVQEW